MKYLLLFIILVCCCFTDAQTRNPALDINRTNIWRFGVSSGDETNDVPGLDFSNGSPVVINSGNNLLSRGATTISNETGNLQLFGANQSAFDKTGNFLSNAGVLGDSGWIGISPCNIAIPMPKSDNLIYYFTAQVSLKYTVVDMNLNNGKGQAIIRNVTLEKIPVEAKLAAVHHCNGSDVWIVGHRWNTNTFYAYLLTDTGLVPTPVISNAGPVANEQGTFQSGSIKFSPDGNKIAIVFNGTSTLPYLFDFDKATGLISNPIPLQKDEADQGISFSPDNSKLYISTNNGTIIQYDLNAGSAISISNSRKLILTKPTTFSIMQLGLDGRIYVGVVGGMPSKYYLTVINKPNNLDTFCLPEFNAIYLNGAYSAGIALMNTIESYFYNGNTAYPCYGDTLTDVPNINNKKGITLKAYPNPFGDYTTIDIAGINANEIIEYKVFDIAGRIVRPEITEKDACNGKQLLFHRAKLPTGVYLLTLKTRDQSQTIKLSIL
jgi:hypothetical protein